MLSFSKSDSLNDESDDDSSDSGSTGTSTFPFRFEKYVGHVDNSVVHVDNSVGCFCGVDSGFFVPIGIDSIGDVVPLVVLVTIGVDSKGGQLIEIFWRSKS